MSSHDEFENALILLESTDANKNTIENGRLIKLILDHAQMSGLSQQAIIRVMKLGSCGRFSQTLSSILIQSLIPKESVPEEAVVYGISRITTGKCQLRMQNLILKWIIVTFAIIVPKLEMYSLYGMLFNLLDYETLCPYICHLLYLMTREHEVTHFRIARLISHQRKVENQSYINGLLSVYRYYQPSLVISSHNKKGRFKKIDHTWTANVFKISAPLTQMGTEFLQSGHSSKAQSCKQSVVPTVGTQVVSSPKMDIDGPFDKLLNNRVVQTCDIKTMDDLIKSIGSMRLPSQAASLLSTRCLQHFLAISPDFSLKIRLCLWIHERLYSRFFEGDSDSEKREERELLDIALTQRELFHMDTSLQEPFLYNYLETWSSGRHTDVVLKLISKLPLLPIEVLRKNVLSALCRHFTSAPNISLQCKIIDSLTELTCNYIVVEMSNTEIEKIQNHQWNNTVNELLNFVNRLIVLGIFLTEGSTRFLYSGLDFWRSVTFALKSSKLEVLALPHFSIIYNGLFSCSSPCLACACSTIMNLIGLYTENLKGRKRLHHSEDLKKLNIFIVDIHDSLWRHSAFHPACSENSVAYKDLNLDFMKRLCAIEDESSIASSFSIDKHPALIICTAQYALDNSISPEQAVTSELLFSTNYIKYLKREGLYNVLKLLRRLTDLAHI